MSFNDLKIVGVVLSFSTALGMGVVGIAMAQMSDGASGTQVVKGSVLDQEGEYYTIKDMSGHELRLHVDKDTKMEERIKVGDRIEAQVTPDGHAKSIRVPMSDAMPSTPKPLPGGSESGY
jgi:hypothetical protein